MAETVRLNLVKDPEQGMGSILPTEVNQHVFIRHSLWWVMMEAYGQAEVKSKSQMGGSSILSLPTEYLFFFPSSELSNKEQHHVCQSSKPSGLKLGRGLPFAYPGLRKRMGRWNTTLAWGETSPVYVY